MKALFASTCLCIVLVTAGLSLKAPSVLQDRAGAILIAATDPAPCSLLKPEEIAAILGGTVDAGTSEPNSTLCAWKVKGASPGATGSLDTIEVSYNAFPGIFTKTSSLVQRPIVELPEISADAFLSVDGFLHMDVKKWGLQIHIGIDKFTSLSSAARLEAEKPIAIKLAKLVLSRL